MNTSELIAVFVLGWFGLRFFFWVDLVLNTSNIISPHTLMIKLKIKAQHKILFHLFIFSYYYLISSLILYFILIILIEGFC